MPEITQKKQATNFKLVWKDERSVIKEYFLNPAITTFIGRDAGNHIILLNPKVSKRHAEIHWSEEYFVIVDQGSSNGTMLNGKDVTNPTPLGNKDQIEIGDFVLNFYISEEKAKEKIKTRPLDEQEPIGERPVSEQLTELLHGMKEKTPAFQAASEAEAVAAALEDANSASLKKPGSPALTLVETPTEAETFLEIPAEKKPSDHLEDPFSELLKSLASAQSSANLLRDKGLNIKKSLETALDQLQGISGKMKKLEAEASKGELEDLIKRLSSAPNDVTLLMELSRHSDLLGEILKDYSAKAAAIEKINAKLETELDTYIR